MNLSTPEKRQIETILNEAETCFSPEDKIEDAVRLLDIQSRQIWEDWDESVANCVIPNDSHELRNTIQSLQNDISELLSSTSSDDNITHKYLDRDENEQYTPNKTSLILNSTKKSGFTPSASRNISTSSTNSKTKSTKPSHKINTTNTALSEKYKPQRKRDSHTFSTSSISNTDNHSSLSSYNQRPNKTKSKIQGSSTFMEVHERNEYNKLRRENLEYAERIKVLRNQLERVNQENESLRNSLHQSMVERSKQKAKLQYLKNERLP